MLAERESNIQVDASFHTGRYITQRSEGLWSDELVKKCLFLEFPKSPDHTEN